VKLKQGLQVTPGTKGLAKEKEDLVIFSILLLISRLIPSFQLVELPETKVLAKPREESIKEYITLIKEYSRNATYFVRKIAAQSILPLIKFESYVSEEIPKYFSELLESVSAGGKKLKQNHAHGLMVRINVFVSAYF